MTTHVIAWQGWSLRVPADWNPVRIDGDHANGTLLLADLRTPRLGLHWTTPPRRVAPADAVDRRLRDEVGRLAAGEAVDRGETPWSVARLYADPDPPGRDVFVGYARASGRLLTVVRPVTRRSDGGVADVLPTLHDTPPDGPTRWAVFDFGFTSPAGLVLRAQRLNAGDLALLFTGPGRRPIVFRQVSPAGLAVARRPTAEWTRHVPFTTPKLYRDDGRPEDIALAEFAPELYAGVRRRLRRKRRLFWAWFVPARQTVLVVHDPPRDRLLIGQGDEGLLADLTASAVHFSRELLPDESEPLAR